MIINKFIEELKPSVSANAPISIFTEPGNCANDKDDNSKNKANKIKGKILTLEINFNKDFIKRIITKVC